MAVRLGKKKALIAIARKILVSIYFILKKKVPYKELGEDYLDSLNIHRKKAYNVNKLKALGFEVEVSLCPKKAAIA